MVSLHCVSKRFSEISCSLCKHFPILILIGGNVIYKLGNQTLVHVPRSPD